MKFNIRFSIHAHIPSKDVRKIGRTPTEMAFNSLPAVAMVVVVVLLAIPTPSSGWHEEETIGRKVIGGNSLDPHTYKFLAGLSIYVKPKKERNGEVNLLCTASVISPKWLISAAHCFGKNGETISVGDCLPGGRCKVNKFGDFEYYPASDMLTIIINFINFNRDYNNADKFTCKRVVLPALVYRGGGYKKYGGYDLALIEASKEMKESEIICLPFGNYPDADRHGTIAGYGFNSRHTCEVNSHGPTKFRYCGTEPDCWTRGHTKLVNRRCEVEFPYRGSTWMGCQRDLRHPGTRDKECRKFYKQMGREFRKYPSVDEFKIYSNETLEKITTCYKPFDFRYGWCGVNMADSLEPVFDIKPHKGWGFCTNTCDDRMDTVYGIAQEKSVDILHQKQCENLMKSKARKEFNITEAYKVKPEVLCVATKHILSTRIYLKGRGRKYKHFDEAHNGAAINKFKDREVMNYIVGPGSCHGDSGGPLFDSVLDPDDHLVERHVLLGTTGSGQGTIGACGGINNPTHYTRITRLRWFVDRYVRPAKGSKDMCYVSPDRKTHYKIRRMRAPCKLRYRGRRNRSNQK